MQSPPSARPFRELLAEEESRLIGHSQTGAQRIQGGHGPPSVVTAAIAARKVTFKCAETSEPERPTGYVYQNARKVPCIYQHLHQLRQHTCLIKQISFNLVLLSVLPISTWWHCWSTRSVVLYPCLALCLKLHPATTLFWSAIRSTHSPNKNTVTKTRVTDL